MVETKYKDFEMRPKWEKLPLIPRDHVFKGIDLEILDNLGWRWDENKNSYFIPYWDRSEKYIPFMQWRHLSGDRRFTFLAGAKPIVYGLWNLDPTNSPLFIVEGTSDAAVLQYCAIPWIAMPSASSGELMKNLGRYCKKEGIELVYAGDNDEAGEKLREALDEVTSYRIRQVPKPYKDWGDFLEAVGLEAVNEYCMPELERTQHQKLPSELSTVRHIFGDIKIIEAT